MITFKKTVLAQRGIIVIQVTYIGTLENHFLDRKGGWSNDSIMAVWQLFGFVIDWILACVTVKMHNFQRGKNMYLKTILVWVIRCEYYTMH